MSLETAVIVGNAESECVKLGRDAMDDEGELDVDEDEEEDMFEYRDVLELEWEEMVLCGIFWACSRGQI